MELAIVGNGAADRSLTAIITAILVWCGTRKRKVRLKLGDDEIEMDHAPDVQQRAPVEAARSTCSVPVSMYPLKTPGER